MPDKILVDWNTTDGSNADIDGQSIAEGNAPATINNAMRAMAGALARIFHALTGEKVTTGTANAQVLATGESYASASEIIVGFTAGAALTNTGACTLAVDSFGAKSVKVADAAGALEDPAAGAISAGGVYLASYEATAGVWVLLNPSPKGLLASYLALAGGTMTGGIVMADQLLTRPVLKDYGETVNAIGSTGGGTQDIDLELGNVVTATVDTSANTFTFSNPPASGTAGSFTLILTNGGSQTVTWPASVDWAGGSAPTLTTSGVDMLTFMTTDGGTTWLGALVGADLK